MKDEELRQARQRKLRRLVRWTVPLSWRRRPVGRNHKKPPVPENWGPAVFRKIKRE